MAAVAAAIEPWTNVLRVVVISVSVVQSFAALANGGGPAAASAVRVQRRLAELVPNL